MKEEKTGRIIIDAENAVLGRLASYAAKQALLGKEVIIVNSEKSIILGREKNIFERYKRERGLGKGGGSAMKGPFFPSIPERIVKRTIRNMLPYKKGRGREAYNRVKCYISIPSEFQDKKMIKSSGRRIGMGLAKISKMLRGGK